MRASLPFATSRHPAFALATVLFVALAAVPATQATVIPGDTSFEFSGQCSDCTGTGRATLLMNDYDPANPSAATFVSFTYESNLFSLTIDPSDLLGFFGSIPFTTTPTPADFLIEDNSFNIFWSVSDSPPSPATPAEWAIGNDIGVPGGSFSNKPGGNQLSVNKDYGTDGVWSLVTVPEPPTLALMLLGLAAVLAAQRRRRAA